jgi:hypothetical protein
MIEKDSLGALVPTETLFEFEEPLTFVCRDRDEQMLLAHSLCAEGGGSRYLAAVTDSRIIDDLKAGRLDILGALRQPRCWIVDFGPGWEIQLLWVIPFDKVPKEMLPRPGAMLSPELEPLFSVRLLGEGVGHGKTSATDVRMAAQAGEFSLKRLAEITHKQRRRTGRPARQVRRYSDLPVQYLRTASFEITFGAPPPEPRLFQQDAEILEEMGKLLGLGLRMIRSDTAFETEDGLDQDEVSQLLEAVKSLTPSTQGDVDRIEIGGRLIEHFEGPTVLTRDDRRRTLERIKPRRRALPEERPFLVAGRIPEADQDALTFTLRDLDPPDVPGVGLVEEILFHFGEHLFEVVMDAFNSPEQVIVVGERVGMDYLALDVRFAGDGSLEGPQPSGLGSE